MCGVILPEAEKLCEHHCLAQHGRQHRMWAALTRPPVPMLSRKAWMDAFKVSQKEKKKNSIFKHACEYKISSVW